MRTFWTQSPNHPSRFYAGRRRRRRWRRSRTWRGRLPSLLPRGGPGSHLVTIGLRWSDNDCCRCPTTVDPLALSGATGAAHAQRKWQQTEAGRDVRALCRSSRFWFGSSDHVRPEWWFAWGGTENQRDHCFSSSIDPLSFRVSLSSCPWIQHEHSWPWAGREISGDCVVERYREIFRDCSWARSINCDSRCTLFLSFSANWQFSSIRL